MPDRSLLTTCRRKLEAAAQVPRFFSNWFTLLMSILLAYLVHRPRRVRFVTRAGAVLESPNLPMARAPVFENLMDDVYRLDTFVPSSDPGGTVVLDFGAHVGAFAIRVAHRLPSARVWCYEPSPATYSYLTGNVAANRLGDRVSCFQEALAGHAGQVEISDLEEGSCVNTTVSPTGPLTSVVGVTFGEALRRAGGEVDIVKLDCEGAEYEGVLSSRPAEWAGVRGVVVEYHPVPGYGWADLERFFTSAGFETTANQPLGDGLGVAWLARRGGQGGLGSATPAVQGTRS